MFIFENITQNEYIVQTNINKDIIVDISGIMTYEDGNQLLVPYVRDNNNVQVYMTSDNRIIVQHSGQKITKIYIIVKYTKSINN